MEEVRDPMTWLRSRGTRVGLALLLALAGLVLMMAAVALAAPEAILFLRQDISKSPERVSARPDLALGGDDDWLVVSWSEGYREYTEFGHVFVRAAHLPEDWGSKDTVFWGGSDVCAHQSAMAVTGTTVHVAYTLKESDCTDPTTMTVRYRSCTLDPWWCTPPTGDGEVITTTTRSILDVDLALDEAGDPHVVWTSCNEAGRDCDLYYARRNGGWSVSPRIEGSGATQGGNRAPAIAVAGGYAHVVWRFDGNLGSQFVYRRSSDGTNWTNQVEFFTSDGDEPDVAARGSTVYAVYELCYKWNPPADQTGECEEYYLLYRRSENSGASWVEREVGTEAASSEDWAHIYDSRDGYLKALQPAVVLNDDDFPVVVWQADRTEDDGDYAIYYQYAITETGAMTWAVTPRTTLNTNHPSELGFPAVGVIGAGSAQTIHVAYAGKPNPNPMDTTWNIVYSSTPEMWDRYSHVMMPIMFRDQESDD